MTSKVTEKSVWGLGGLTWKMLALRTWNRIQKDDVLSRAAQLSYFFIFSLFPLLFFLASLLGYFTQSSSDLRDSLLNYLGAVVPPKASLLIRETLDEITRTSSGGKITFGLLVALWTSSFGVGAIIATLNDAYGVKESRPWWKSQVLAVSMTIALASMIIVALLIMLYGGEMAGRIAQHFAFNDFFSDVWPVVQWAIVLGFVMFGFAFIYYFAPNIKGVKWQWITPGSIAGIMIWMLVSLIFRLYLRFFDTYSKTYGSLGAVMILLLWLYLTGVAILIGGELNAVIEDAAARAGDPEAKERGEKEPGDKEIGKQEHLKA